MAITIQPENILRDLNELWEQLDEDQSGSGGVLRACAMTLVATARDDQDAEQVRRTLGVLMHEHPSRAVILETSEGAALDAHVFAECWKPFGSSQQICSEGIEIVSDPEHLDDVAQVLLPLRVPDLPSVVWCRGSSVFHLRYFDALFPVADKIIFDSSAVMGAAAALNFLRRLRARGFRVADLHWTRLTGWREVLAHLFDDEALRAERVTTARLAYGGAAPSTCTLYFASWIENALPDAHVSLVSEAGGLAGETGLRSVKLSTRTCDLSLTKDGSSILVQGCGRNYRSPLPPLDEETLMRDELKILGRDPVYEAVLG